MYELYWLYISAAWLRMETRPLTVNPRGVVNVQEGFENTATARWIIQPDFIDLKSICRNKSYYGPAVEELGTENNWSWFFLDVDLDESKAAVIVEPRFDVIEYNKLRIHGRLQRCSEQVQFDYQSYLLSKLSL